MRIALAAVATLLSGTVMQAHGLGEALTEPRALSPWDLLAVGLLVGITVLYVRGSWRMAGRGAVQRHHEPVAFAIGIAVLLASILPPLDALALQLFSAHMAQHELMMLIGAPLLIGGRPLSTCLWGLPDRWRPSAARLLQGKAAGATGRALTAPVIAWALHGLVIWAWHVPLLYEWAVHNESVHALQHTMFIGTSALFWWGLMYGRYGRAGYGAAVFYVFTTAVHTGILGALVTFAGTPIYPSYIGPSLAHGTDALSDQQVAGLLMWVPAGIIFTVMGLALFLAWIGESERRMTRKDEARTRAAAAGARVTLVLLAASLLTSACARNDNDRIARQLTGGEPSRGRVAIHNYGCDGCHTIPGILTADATVGPPLTQIGRRSYLAGRLENTPENMMQWIKHPRSIDDQTAMPETGVNDQDGRDIVAYLYTLR